MGVGHLLRDQVTWKSSLGDSEIPGVRNDGPEQTIPARVLRTTHDVGGDRVSRETVWTFPEHEPKPGDALNGGQVLEVEAAKDAAGHVLFWISHLER